MSTGDGKWRIDIGWRKRGNYGLEVWLKKKDLEARLGGVHKLGCGEGMAGSSVDAIEGERRVG